MSNAESKSQAAIAMSTNSIQWSYARHTAHEAENHEIPSCYSNPESIDAWRHRRALSSLLPLIRYLPEATWMTVGDGNYGSDAYFLQSQGADVVATSISDKTLSIAHQQGYIKQFRVENAEKLSALDDSYDFLLCKECYHHFPRPPLGFYEMLRVAKRAVVLIEPIEGEPRLLDRLKTGVKKVLRKDQSCLFEPSGNFIYRTSLREIEKMLTALNYSHIAFWRFNDFFAPRISYGKMSPSSLGTLITHLGIALQNLLCALGLMNYGLATVIAFKEPASEALQQQLKAAGFTIVPLAENPYRS